MEQTTATQPEQEPRAAKPEASCPHCGEPAEKDQLVCLRCGGRIALDYRRPPGWKLPTAIVAGVALIAAVAFGWALREITDDAKTEVAKAPAAKPVPPPGPTAAERAAQRRDQARHQAADRRQAAADRKSTSKTKRRAAARKSPARPSPAGAVDVAGTWPTGKNGFTVILGSTDNPGSAKDTTRQARQAGVRAGYLRSNDYPSLQKGFWYVYGGVYKTRGKAEKAAARFGRGYPGAYVQWVDGAKAGRKKKR
jgi:hypothetical protein